jgi:hypothetical protein
MRSTTAINSRILPEIAQQLADDRTLTCWRSNST